MKHPRTVVGLRYHRRMMMGMIFTIAALAGALLGVIK